MSIMSIGVGSCHAQNHGKVQEKEEFVGDLANGAQADNEKEAESTDSEDSISYESHVESFWFHAKE